MGATYQQRRDQSNAIHKAQAAAGRDIAPIPAVANPARREACRLNLRLFLETYYPDAFRLEWSEDHLRVIEKIQRVALKGQLFRKISLSSTMGVPVKIDIKD